MNIFFWILVSILSSLLIIKGSEWLEESSIVIAKEYGIPSVVRGSIITAFGSSFPELSTVIIATLLHGEFELGMSVVIGSAIFNIIVIPAVSGISSGGLEIDGKTVKKELSIYSLVVFIMGVFFSLSYYLDGSKVNGVYEATLNSGIAFILILLYILYVVYQFRITKDSDTDNRVKKVDSLNKMWLYLIFGLIFIGLGVEGLVRSVLVFGEILGVPNFFWGVVVVAGASSLPDALVSMRQAGDEYDSTSIANVVGSNIFDLLFIVSIGVILAGGAVINISVNIPLIVILLIFTLSTAYFIIKDNKLTVKESYIMITLYISFVIWIVLEAFGFVSIIYG